MKKTIRALISSKEILTFLADKFGNNAKCFPSIADCQILLLEPKAFDMIDPESDVEVVIVGFEDLRVELLGLMLKYSQTAPIAYLERTNKNKIVSESVVALDKGKTIFEGHHSANAIANFLKARDWKLPRQVETILQE